MRSSANWLGRSALEHPFMTVFLVALVLRVAIAVTLTATFSGVFVHDDTTYHLMARDAAAHDTGNWDEYTHTLYGTTSAFMIPLTFIYAVFGPNMFAGQVFVAFIGAGVAALTARLAFEMGGLKAALVAGFIIAAWPSQVLWSSLLMKDAAVWFGLAGLGAAVAVGSQATGRRLLIAGVIAGCMLFLLSYLRLHTLVVASWALMISSFFTAKRDRLARVAGSLVLGLTFPWMFGAIGPAGFLLITQHGSLEERRFANAQGASTAIVSTPSPNPAAQARARDLENQAAAFEDSDPKRAEELRAQALEERAVAEREERGSAGSAEVPLDPNLRHLPRGLSVMLLEPFPLPFVGSMSLRLARLESLVWYPLLLLAGLGLWNVRTYLRQMAFPIVAAGGILVMYALSEGNLGTAHRHRGEFVWVVAVLAAIGVNHLRAPHREASGEGA